MTMILELGDLLSSGKCQGTASLSCLGRAKGQSLPCSSGGGANLVIIRLKSGVTTPRRVTGAAESSLGLNPCRRVRAEVTWELQEELLEKDQDVPGTACPCPLSLPGVNDTVQQL